MNKIQKFIQDNNLNLEDSGSGLNSTCCAIAGYALYASNDTHDYSKLLEDIEEDGLYDLTSEVSSELERVYDYAYNNNYYSWWETLEAQNKYVFETNKE